MDNVEDPQVQPEPLAVITKGELENEGKNQRVPERVPKIISPITNVH